MGSLKPEKGTALGKSETKGKTGGVKKADSYSYDLSTAWLN